MLQNNDDRYVKPDDVLFQKLEGEAVLLNLTSEFYYGLDEVGCRMYELLTNAPSIKSAYETLLQEYNVDPIQLHQDFVKLLNDLVESGLISRVEK